MHTPFTLWMNFSHVQMLGIANLYDYCKCIFYTVLFLYICMFYDMFHILLSCDSLLDPRNVYCIVLYRNRNGISFSQWRKKSIKFYVLIYLYSYMYTVCENSVFKVLVHFFGGFLCWVFIIDEYFSLWRIVICSVVYGS